jgi:hypothetical protein
MWFVNVVHAGMGGTEKGKFFFCFLETRYWLGLPGQPLKFLTLSASPVSLCLGHGSWSWTYHQVKAALPDLINSIDRVWNSMLIYCVILLKNGQFKTSTVFVILYIHFVFSRYDIETATREINHSVIVTWCGNKMSHYSDSQLIFAIVRPYYSFHNALKRSFIAWVLTFPGHKGLSQFLKFPPFYEPEPVTAPQAERSLNNFRWNSS